MSTHKRCVDDPAETDAVTVEVDPRYAARHAVDRPTSEPKDTVAETPASPVEDRLERIARRLGDFWGRAFMSAVRTAFPPGTVADIKRRWSRRPEKRSTRG